MTAITETQGCHGCEAAAAAGHGAAGSGYPGGCPCGGPEAARWDTLAERIVRTHARIREGEVVQIGGGLHTLCLVEALALAVRRAGAFPELNVNSQRLMNRMVTETPLEYLARPPVHRLRWLEDVDAVIATDTVADPRGTPAISRERQQALAAGWGPLEAAMAERGIRSFYVPFPAGMPGADDPLGLLEGALGPEPEELKAAGAPVAARLLTARRMRVTGPAGADFTLEWAEAAVHLEDGVLDEEDGAAGQTFVELPGGVVVALLASPAMEGRWAAPYAYWGGERVEAPRVELGDGRVQSVVAEGSDQFPSPAAAGGRRPRVTVARVAFGFNPRLTGLSGHTLLDMRMAGAVTVVLEDGRSRREGDEPAWQLPLVLPEASVWLDDELVLDRGRAVVGEGSRG